MSIFTNYGVYPFNTIYSPKSTSIHVVDKIEISTNKLII